MDGQYTSLTIPCPMVAQSREVPSAVVTKSLSLEHHVGGIPGDPKAGCPWGSPGRGVLLVNGGIRSYARGFEKAVFMQLLRLARQQPCRPSRHAYAPNCGASLGGPDAAAALHELIVDGVFGTVLTGPATSSAASPRKPGAAAHPLPRGSRALARSSNKGCAHSACICRIHGRDQRSCLHCTAVRP